MTQLHGMSAAAPPAPPRLSTTVDVETPELVLLSYTIAGIGSRAYAAMTDYLICVVAQIAVLVAITFFFSKKGPEPEPAMSTSVALAIMVLIQFIIVWGYYVIFEALADGRTIGKRLHRLRVVRDGGYSITFGASAVRNLMRIIDMQPGIFYGVGMTSVFVSKSGKRLGDMAAGTIVVKEDLVRTPAAQPVPASGIAAAPAPLHAVLSADEFEVLERFSQRQGDLDPGRRADLAAQLAARFASAVKDYPGSTPAAQLANLYSAERGARAAGAASSQDTGAARERHAIVAREGSRWAGFAATLARVQRTGLKGLDEHEVREFVAEYRDVSSDLARLRTAARGNEVDEVFYLNRLVASAHNLLYRRQPIALRDVSRFLFGDVPREIRASALPILLAAAMMFGPAAIAGDAVLHDPGVAATLLPPGMLDRADDGVRRAKTGDGYIQDPQLFRPVMATTIIANNVQVAIAAFASGVTAGVLTAYLLVSNGVSFGAVFGLYGSKGIATLLLAFVAPHGVLELTAICIAGGAGFLLAAALLIPGERTRRRALVENGRRAIKLVAGAALLLLIAGSLEGMVSPIPWWPLEWKLSVSALTAVFLYAYIRGAGAKPVTGRPAT